MTTANLSPLSVPGVQAPMLLNNVCRQTALGQSCRSMVVAAQKSGWVWALNADNGQLHWAQQVRSGGGGGGPA
jgi:hypothetical protein